MKACPALPTVTAHDVHRSAAVRTKSKAAPKPAPAVEIQPDADGVLRVFNPALGIACPCSTPAVAAQLSQFFKR